MSKFERKARDAVAYVMLTSFIAALWVYEKCGGKPFRK